MPRIRIHPGQSVGLPLTAAERALIADCMVLDTEYIERVTNAPPDKPEVPFTLDELDDLAGHIAFEANHCDKRKRQSALDAIFNKIEKILDTYTDDEDEPDDEVTAADALDVLLSDSATAEEKDAARLIMFLEEMEGMCKAAGMSLDTVLERIKPTTIEPEEPVGLYISPREKELLLGLEDLAKSIKDRLHNAPKSKRKFELPFREVLFMERVVSNAISSPPSEQAGRQLMRFHDKLFRLQQEYVTPELAEHAVERALAGDRAAVAAAAGQLMQELAKLRRSGKAQDR
jgi:hypothetical protein